MEASVSKASPCGTGAKAAQRLRALRLAHSASSSNEAACSPGCVQEKRSGAAEAGVNFGSTARTEEPSSSQSHFVTASSIGTANDHQFPGASEFYTCQSLEKVSDVDDDSSSCSGISELSEATETDSEYAFQHLESVRRDTVTSDFPAPLDYLHPTEYMEVMRTYGVP
eukprot:TRINITY_DN8263_c0_g1_i3.p1 TRINITY_DN8263_c0_g1~~TRINITY_DN8263_c0_g1_i3.p1  ORF type:complete len:183 (+),score=25.83 TRINITY_DN8263_c0_g1_i3:47-550(+)